MYHQPVMLKEAIEALQIKEDGIYIDVTFGGGGHAKEILKQLTTGKLVAFDQDKDATANVAEDDRLIFINQNFRHLKKYLKLYSLTPINGILADLGVSSHQFDTPERGFSTRFEGDLDMRMDDTSDKTAADILKTYTKDQLQQVFSKYGEVRNSKTLAELIVHSRDNVKLNTTEDFIQMIDTVIHGNRNKYLAQVFQAIRIEVNAEMEALEQLLEQSADVLCEGGRLVVLSYHSLEDRMAKNFIKNGVVSGEPEKDLYGNFNKLLKAINKKPIVASVEEIESNPRARSAKMRVAEKI